MILSKMVVPDHITIRNASPRDHQIVVSVIPEWWGGRDLRTSVPKLFFIHFSPTSFIAEKDGELAGFLVGFLSLSSPKEAYIHFAGVRPDLRKKGIAKSLYNTFFQAARHHGRTIVRSCTAPENKLSIMFHRSMGFVLEPGDAVIDGLPVTRGYLKENEPKVVFKCCI